MNRILKSFVTEFTDGLGFECSENDAFEHFSNYSIINSRYNDSFDIGDVHIGKDSTVGIDGLAIIINGRLVTSKEEAQDIIDIGGELKVQYIFIQSKSSEKFDGAAILGFGDAVRDFIREDRALAWSESAKQYLETSDTIINNYARLTSAPRCDMFYVTAGSWQGDQNIQSRIASTISHVQNEKVFSEVNMTVAGCDELQKWYSKSKELVEATINFENYVILPKLTGIKESFFGFIPISEFKKLLADINGNIAKTIFYDNVRDFQGTSNTVNESIKSTLDGGVPEIFVVLNNGVTVVAEKVSRSRNEFTLQGYQIVNGCQTSHVIFESDAVDNVCVPIKLIVTENNELTNQIIKSTNHQTEVTEEDIIALSSFQKDLEQYYATYSGKGRLYYERRSKQYNNDSTVPKIKIISKSMQLKAFASMFLGKPNRASRYYGTLLSDVKNSIFKTNHSYKPYYVSAYSLYVIESLFRKKEFDWSFRKFRFAMLPVLREVATDWSQQPKLNSKKIDKYCESILDFVNDTKKIKTFIKNFIKCLNGLKIDTSSSDSAKKSGLEQQLISTYKQLQTKVGIHRKTIAVKENVSIKRKGSTAK
ncbi:MAG: AIPR family protein [Pseudodesulfovibrio sp.]|uniref:AIPR family protein n=1 Tax=Pseudodesulfovibrio sp. TaxID=2035812 RepID=UPI003D1162DC